MKLLLMLAFSAIASGQTKYAGWIDRANCGGISGWVADLARPDFALTVSMWEGTTMVSSMMAATPRPDVGQVIKDKGLHGFTFFNVPSDGIKHLFQLHFEASGILLNAPISLQCGIAPVLSVVREVPSGPIDGLNGSFSLSATPNPSYPVLLYRNGLLQAPCGLIICPACSTSACDGDYTITGATIRFLSATETFLGISLVPAPGTKLQAVWWK